MFFKYSAVAAISASLAACATSPDKIEPVSAPPYAYASYDCDQLIVEAQTLTNRAVTVYDAQVSRHKHDVRQAIVAFVIHWPAIFFIKGDGREAEEVAHLKGRMQAVENASEALNQDGCRITFTNT